MFNLNGKKIVITHGISDLLKKAFTSNSIMESVGLNPNLGGNKKKRWRDRRGLSTVKGREWSSTGVQ